MDATPPEIAIVPLDPGSLDAVEPLWRSLLDRIRVPENVVPIVPHADSWPRRRTEYEELLAGDGFGLLALRSDKVIGYAVVRVEDSPDPVWMTGGVYAELTSLSVAPQERGRGVGSRLLEAVGEELSRRGIEGMVIGVDAVNDAALRLYERIGFRVGYHLLYGPVEGLLRRQGSSDEASPEAAAGAVTDVAVDVAVDASVGGDSFETASHGEA